MPDRANEQLYPLATKYRLRLPQNWKSPTSRLLQYQMSKKNISFLNVPELPGQLKDILTKSPMMAWEEVTLSQCLFCWSRSSWRRGNSRSLGSMPSVTLLAAASAP